MASLRRLPLVLALALTAGALTGVAFPEDQDAEKKVTLLYTTDIHGHYLPHVSVPGHAKGDKVPQPESQGGFAGIGAKVKEIRAEAKNPVFLFDSGDVMTGHPVCDLDYKGVLGGSLIWMMNAIGYDAWCIGNHDFDHGRENATKVTQLANFPTLSANLVVEGEPALKIERWKILEKDGVRVGVFGLMTESLLQVVVRDRVKGITVSSAADAAREAVAALTSRCDVIVALSHCGSDEDVKLADRVPGIHVILSGHNHQALKASLHGKTIISEGHFKAHRLGQLDLTLKNGEVVAHKQKFLSCDAGEPDGELKTALDYVRDQVGKRLEEVLGKLESSWARNYNGESNIGNFFADGLRAYAKADVAFLNAGGIRTNVPAGDVTLGHVQEIFPFDNQLVTFELTGKDLIRAISKNANAAAGQEYGVLQISGIRYEYEKHGRKAHVTKTECGGAPIDPEKTYRCAAIDFIAIDQHEKYLGPDVTVSKIEKLNVAMTKVAEDYVRAEGKKGPIRAEVDGRMHEAR